MLEANRAAEQLLDVPAHDLVGTPLAAMVGPAVQDVLGRASGNVERLELAVRPRGGASLRVEVAVRLLDPLARESVGAVAWSFADVEEREAAREQLHALAQELEERVAERTAEVEAQRARLEAVLGGMPAGVLVADARSRRIVQANAQAEQLLGTALVGVVIPQPGVPAFGARGEPLAPGDWPLARALLHGEEVLAERLHIERDGGERLVLEVNASPIRDAHGRTVAAVAVFSDASERERRERAEREFVANAAHELQTPLAAIASAAEVLDTGAKDDPANRERFIAHIRRECDRLTRLVQALLMLARAQTEAERPPVERVELRQLLDAVALSLNPASGVEVRVQCSAGLATFANRFLLEQAVAGLGGNAAKYTPRGTIWLRARRLSDGSLEIEVADEGEGIPRGEEERLFDRFYRGGTRDRSGFGLGLAIVREAVAALGGEIELRRRRGRGTAARILLRELAAP